MITNLLFAVIKYIISKNKYLLDKIIENYISEGNACFKQLYLIYYPDSEKDFNKHPEFSDLQKKFIYQNVFNNAGDISRLWSFILNIKKVVFEDKVEGDFAELGVYKGNAAAILAYYASKSDRTLFLFDTFEGFDARDLKGVDSNHKIAFNDTSVDLVKNIIGENVSCCEFVKGYFPESCSSAILSRKFSVVSLDCDLYDPMKAGLDLFYPLMPKGGIFLLHDYSSCHWKGAKQAIDEFCMRNNEFPILLPDKSGSAFIRKAA